jgi:hypothetical protein
MSKTTTLLTVEELSEESGYPVKTLYGLLAPAGDLPCIRTAIGPSAKRRTRGRIRIRRTDWDAWLDRHASGPRADVKRSGSALALPGADRYAAR